MRPRCSQGLEELKPGLYNFFFCCCKKSHFFHNFLVQAWNNRSLAFSIFTEDKKAHIVMWCITSSLMGVISFQTCDHLIKVSNFKEAGGHEERDHGQVARVVPHGAVDPTSDQFSNLMGKDRSCCSAGEDGDKNE